MTPLEPPTLGVVPPLPPKAGIELPERLSAATKDSPTTAGPLAALDEGMSAGAACGALCDLTT